MSIRISPYLNFAGSAREAMSFYREVFGGELTIDTFGDYDMAENPEDRDKVMHSQLQVSPELSIMASDAPPGMPLDTGAQVSVAVFDDDPAETERLGRMFEALSTDGGQVTVPFEKAPWGDVFGMCVDRFGISWLFDGAARNDG
ncbi:VOC family protein [Brevibacterium daeguense]|uniref:VOC family protein n=1 Tax=Brevibacterium daeguense TaxID=909936 RepID=A0ABP8EKB5_9MICO|nr:VOC family protein [Brevibacterium daeguense]